MTNTIETRRFRTPVEQFDYWREAVCETWFGLHAERKDRNPFEARVEMHHAGEALLAAAQLPPHRLGRGPVEIGRSTQAAYCLHYLRAGVVHGSYRGIDYQAQPGDLLLFDTGELCDSFVIDKHVETIIVHLPRDLLFSQLGASAGASIHLSATKGAGALLAGYMSCLTQTVSTLSPAALNKAGEVLRDLIAAAFAPTPAVTENRESGIRHARLTAAQQFIRANLKAPQLSVSQVAAHLCVSERYVHKLFAPTGRTFNETLIAARLEACYQVFRTSQGNLRTVADIAFEYGFNDLSWFYRCYRTRWGETPRETRFRSHQRNN